MDDEKEAEETSNRGNEWEVVSLTASTYAAAPGPKSFESSDDDHGNEFSRNKQKTSGAMFMSGHFEFPPSQHENLPLEPDDSKIHSETLDEDVGPEEESGSDVVEGDRSGKINEEIWNIKGMALPDELHAIPFFEEKDKSVSVHATEFEAGKALRGINLVEEQSIYDAAKLSSFHDGADISGSAVCDESIVIPEHSDSSQLNVDSSSDSSEFPSPTKDNKYNGSGLPCEAWWKRQAASWYAQAKEANGYWSVFVAAALMGLVILGQHWQQERWQIQQLKWQFSINDEKMNWMMGPISRLKDVIVGGHRRGSIIKGRTPTER